MTYAAPLKATLQLVVFEEVEGEKRPEEHHREGGLPRRAADHDPARDVRHQRRGARRGEPAAPLAGRGVRGGHHPNGQRLFSARIIPFRGSWVEFTIDIHDVIYVHIDKKKKFPATALLRAFGYGENADILRLFFATKELSHHGQDRRPGRRGARCWARCWPRTCRTPRSRRARPLGVVGDELTPERLNAMRHAGVKTVDGLRGLHHARPPRRGAADDHARAGRPVLAFAVADPATARCWPRPGADADRDAARASCSRRACTRSRCCCRPAAASQPADQEHAAPRTRPTARPRPWSRSTPCSGRATRPTCETAREQLQRLFFNPKRYDLGRVGRYKINQRLKLKTRPEPHGPDRGRLHRDHPLPDRPERRPRATPTTSTTSATAASARWAS